MRANEIPIARSSITSLYDLIDFLATDRALAIESHDTWLAIHTNGKMSARHKKCVDFLIHANFAHVFPLLLRLLGAFSCRLKLLHIVRTLSQHPSALTLRPVICLIFFVFQTFLELGLELEEQIRSRIFLLYFLIFLPFLLVFCRQITLKMRVNLRLGLEQLTTVKWTLDENIRARDGVPFDIAETEDLVARSTAHGDLYGFQW